MGRAGHADMIGQLKALLEGARGDAAMQVCARRLILGLSRGNDELGLALLDRKLCLGEARNGDRDAVGIIRRLFDVVRGVGLGAVSCVRTRSRRSAIRSKPTVAR
jgi:hypothetical protein